MKSSAIMKRCLSIEVEPVPEQAEDERNDEANDRRDNYEQCGDGKAEWLNHIDWLDEVHP